MDDNTAVDNRELQIRRVDRPADEVVRLYLGTFPDDERRPLREWREMIASGRVTLLEIECGGESAGFATLWHMPQMVYVEHFAIVESMRGGGVGGRTVEWMVEAAGALPLVLEVERPEASESARRRIAFYERCGLHIVTGGEGSCGEAYDYMQPPYAAGLSPVPMLLMSSRSVDGATVAVALRQSVYHHPLFE